MRHAQPFPPRSSGGGFDTAAVTPHSARVPDTAAAPRPSRTEALVVLAALGGACVLKLLYAARYRVNSDEGQHLHVAWAWTQGLVQYRDVSDNHMPLFHVLFAPLIAAIGERPDVVNVARIAMVPLFVISLVATYALARALLDRRAALRSVTITALLPAFFLTTTEVRADDLSTCLSLAGLAFLHDARDGVGRSFAAGLLLGAAAVTSLKAVVLVAALVGGTLLVSIAVDGRIASFPPRVRALAAWIGLAAFPLALVVGLGRAGLLATFVSEVLHRDLVGAMAIERRRLELLGLTPAAVPLVWFAAREIAARGADPLAGRALASLFATTLLALTAIVGLSPLLRPQDALALYPLLCVLAVALAPAASFPERLGGARGIAVVVAAEIVLLFASAPPWRPADVAHAARIRDVLRLTDPGERVMDLKGETIFRPRAVRLVLEQVTRAQIDAGLVPDDIPEQLAAREVTVAVHDSRNIPPRTKQFLNDSYVNVGRVRVIGRRVTVPAGGGVIRFEVGVPGRYVVVSPRGLVPQARVDGVVVASGRRLEPGGHQLDPAGEAGPLAVVWSRAVERGFSPFSSGG